jgi:hypothetical protein
MKPPNRKPTPSILDKPRRPARSTKEIRRRQRGEDYQSVTERLVYALLNGLLYGFGGLIIDLAVVIIRSVLDIGSGDIFWLFTPALCLLGIIIGFVVGKSSGADSVGALHTSDTAPYIDDYSIRHDVFRGVIFGIIIFAVIWLVMMIIA